jgi:hypothetical protein
MNYLLLYLAEVLKWESLRWNLQRKPKQILCYRTVHEMMWQNMVVWQTADTARIFNSLNAELNPICHLLVLVGAHHIVHVNRVRVNNSFSTATVVTRTPRSLRFKRTLPVMFNSVLVTSNHWRLCQTVFEFNTIHRHFAVILVVFKEPVDLPLFVDYVHQSCRVRLKV